MILKTSRERGIIMTKQKIKRIMAVSTILIFAMGTTVYAQRSDMEEGGFAYLDVERSNNMKKVDAGTERPNGQHSYMSTVWLETAYEDGSCEEEQDGPDNRDTSISHPWEWALDYSSIHTVLSSPSKIVDRVFLSEY